jgi:hypothetical protein
VQHKTETKEKKKVKKEKGKVYWYGSMNAKGDQRLA